MDDLPNQGAEIESTHENPLDCKSCRQDWFLIGECHFMYIKEIRISNIRGFESLEFNLDRGGERFAGWTVFTGNNGSGKSSFLKAIAVALVGTDTARALQASYNGWLRKGNSSGSVELQILRTSADDRFSRGGRDSNNIEAVIDFKNGARELSLDSRRSQRGDRTIWSADAAGWFSCAYGPFRRIFGASSESARQMAAPLTRRYVTMFQESASLSEVAEWLKELHYKSLENRQIEKERLNLLIRLLNDELLPEGIAVSEVNSDGLWLKDDRGLELSWSDMSDGYRSALALVSDILRHMIDVYGHEDLIGENGTGSVFVKRSGVVLIDEIDAHLHPEWQQRIGFWLKAKFPAVQFLVTTHSPLICQAADANGIFVFPSPGSEDVPKPISKDEYRRIIASRPDTILLSEAFGLSNSRSPLAVERRQRYSRLMTKKKSSNLTEEEQVELSDVAAFATIDEEI